MMTKHSNSLDYLARGIWAAAIMIVSAPQTAWAQAAPPDANTAASLPPAPPPPGPPEATPPPPPMPPPYGYGYPPVPVYNTQAPKTLPYEEGAEIPYGYRKVTTRRIPFIIAGATTFGVFYLMALTGASLSSKPQYAIPIIGPLFAVERPSSNALSQVVNAFANTMYIIDVVGQLSGAVLFAVGMPEKTYLLRNDVVAFKPKVSIGPGSISMTMHF